jgi:uncharacterized protein YydD (DUF2326 family)
MATKTKAMLLEEIQQKNEEINELKKDLENLKKYEAYNEAASELKAMHDSFLAAGFNSEQAFKLVVELIKTSGVVAKYGRR